MCGVEWLEYLLSGDVGSEWKLRVCLLMVVEVKEKLQVQRNVCCMLSVFMCLRPFTWVSFRRVKALADVPKSSVRLRVCARCVFYVRVVRGTAGSTARPPPL